MLSRQIAGMMDKSSLVRKMFEAGIELKKRHGAENVFDFSLGNPDLPPPPGVPEAMLAIAQEMRRPYALGYMPNAGYPDVREALAGRISEEQGMAVPAARVVAACGAAGAINAFLRAVLDPGDEVACAAPYFVEYGFYAANFGGTLRPAMSKRPAFDLDLDAIAAVLTDRTRVFLLNSPNNPTGRIYPEEDVRALAGLLSAHERKTGRPLYLLSDEPYRFLNYDGRHIPSVFAHHANSVVAGSFSKSLSLAGERVGYLAVNPAMEGGARLVDAVILATRTLGYVNAPAIGQRLAAACMGHTVDLGIYAARRAAMAAVLTDAGIAFTPPDGAFYFFPQSPIPDDAAFCDRLLANRVLAVPGRGFGAPGYFRLAFCVDESTIARSSDAFRKTMRDL